MSNNNATVFNCSLTNYDNMLKRYGKGSTTDLNLVKLIYKYACYSTSQDILNRLDSMVSVMQQGSSICINYNYENPYFESLNYNSEDPINPSDPTPPTPPTDPIPDTNKAPTVDDHTINTDNVKLNYDTSKKGESPEWTQIHRLGKFDFLTNFQDPNGDSYSKIKILSAPGLEVSPMQIRYADSSPIYPGLELNLSDLDKEPWTVWKLTDNSLTGDITYIVSDDNENTLWSAPIVLTINQSADSTKNSPATTGDYVTTVENNVITVLVSSFFTDTNPAYSDPESDPLDAIRIDRVSSSNLGEFLYLGVPVSDGQIITKAELDAGDFVHDGANQDAISTDNLDFSLRDSGSLIWVS